MAREEDVWRAQAKLKLEKMPEEAKQIRETALQDLFFFARLVNPGYMYGEIHKEIFQWMQEYTLFGLGKVDETNKLIMLPRAHLKSHMVATWASWVVTRHPEVTILYVSATSGLAETQLYAIKNILESPNYTRYFPEYIHPQEGKREKWTQTAISIDHIKRKTEGIRDATIATAGLTTNTTGWHADILIPDDLVVPENAYTEDGRESVSKKASQFTSILNAGGFTMACGTRYHPSDIYASWKEQQFDIYDENDEVVGRENVWSIKEYAVETDGIFIWPRSVRPSDGKAFGFNNQVLAKIRAQYEDRVQFYAQYYNDPNDKGSNRIDRSKFQYYDKKFLKQQGGSWYFKGKKLNVYAAIDFAFSLSKKSDNTAIVVIGMDEDGFIYVLDIDCFKSDKISEYFNHLVELHSQWDFKKLRAEVTVAQTVIVRDLKDKIRSEGLTISIDEHRPTRNEGTKAERIAAALEHKYENQTIWHFRGGYTDVLEEELILARPAHDDCKDALASAVEIATKPKRSRSLESDRTNVVQFSSRFGGVAFRG
jgi:phage terminase large subunit-like protein